MFNVGKDLETEVIEFGLLLVLKVCSNVTIHINIDSNDPPGSPLPVIKGICCIHAHGGEEMKDSKPLKQHERLYTSSTTT